MHQNIKNNNVKSIDAKLYSGNYYDFMLYKGETVYQDLSNLSEISMADFSDLNIVSGILYSTTTWSGATNNGVEMNDIGLTGMDNGLISFKKDRITNEQFLDLLLESQYTIDSGDTRLFLTPVTGNTQEYEYPLYLVETEDEKYIACKGGFYQGFFKLLGHEYQVLPENIENEWFMHFDIRPRSDYEIAENTINYLRAENKDIFFFMGTRAENKFWPFYKTNKEITDTLKKKNAYTEGYFDNCGLSGETYNASNNVVFLENDWLVDEFEPIIEEESYFAVGDKYFADTKKQSASKIKPSDKTLIFSSNKNTNVSLNNYGFNPEGYCGCSSSSDSNNNIDCCCNDYFGDNYYDDRCPGEGNNKAFANEYIGSGKTINKNGYDDSAGHAMSATGYNDIISDNKFLLFDRTPSGFTVDTWVEGSKVMLTRRQNWPNANYFLLMNRTPTGYTIDTIDQYNTANEYDYNIHKDIRGNVFALKITEDGAIGYRYGILNCDAENKYEVVEEYSKPNLIKKDEWNSINVRFSVLNPSSGKKDKKMKIMFYVNGNLVFISKELDAFSFKGIDEVYQKQEGVPYNISLGGGTLGLLESILPNYYAVSDYILPIEKDFCGSFLGDIKSFKMYGGFVNYSTIINYLS